MRKTEIALDELIRLRHELHRQPELSGEEVNTAATIADFLRAHGVSEVKTGVGGNGVLGIIDSGNSGPTVLFRCELDGLPIHDDNTDLAYSSTVNGKGHKCGHDGHMAILCGLALSFEERPLKRGKAILLFQPAEETGQGAEAVLSDEKFQEIRPDHVFALHNVPGHQRHHILVRDGHFAAASRGFIIRLKGRTSHAAEPDKGLSPGQAMAELVQKLQLLPEKIKDKEGLVLLTLVHAKLGEPAFGISPGEAVVMATLRTHSDTDIEKLSDAATQLASEVAERYGLAHSTSFSEIFPACDNRETQIVRVAAAKQDLQVEEMAEPFRWSEDFGHFLQHYPGALFGLGAGRQHPVLHDGLYDFPDEIISTGVGMLREIWDGIID